jgi:hypothetical protein
VHKGIVWIIRVEGSGGGWDGERIKAWEED